MTGRSRDMAALLLIGPEPVQLVGPVFESAIEQRAPGAYVVYPMGEPRLARPT